MTVQWNAGLLEPISADTPCGKNLEDSGELALLEAYQLFGLFGQTTLEASFPGTKEPKREPRKSDRPPNWGEVEELAIDCLSKSKDIRVLAYLAASVLRTKGIPAFVSTLGAASQWLETYWTSVYPLVDEDAVLRTNALSSFADRAAVIDGLRRATLVSGRLGRFSYRDLEEWQSWSEAADPESAGKDSGVKGAFIEIPIDDLRALHASAVEGAAIVRKIDETMSTQAGVESSPAFKPLLDQLEAMASALQARLADHPAAVAGVDVRPDGAAAAGAGGGGAVGPVRSRQDAIRALDAVAEFFRQSEPSSPVPLLVDRAKRLVSKSFLDVLADVAPGGLPEAKSAGGIRE